VPVVKNGNGALTTGVARNEILQNDVIALFIELHKKKRKSGEFEARMWYTSDIGFSSPPLHNLFYAPWMAGSLVFCFITCTPPVTLLQPLLFIKL